MFDNDLWFLLPDIHTLQDAHDHIKTVVAWRKNMKPSQSPPSFETKVRYSWYHDCQRLYINFHAVATLTVKALYHGGPTQCNDDNKANRK